MSERLTKKLLKKGWKHHEINKTLKIIEAGKQKKHKHIKLLDASVYWIALIVAIIGNIAILFTLLPLLLFLKGWGYYLIIGILGFSFGLLFEILIRDIENLETHHHILISSLLPAVTIINFFIITRVLNNFLTRFNLSIQVPLFMGIFYTVIFLLPYILYHTVYKHRQQSF